MGKKIFDENGNFLGELDENILNPCGHSRKESAENEIFPQKNHFDHRGKTILFNFDRKTLLSFVSIVLIVAVVIVTLNAAFKTDSDIVHDFLDEQETVQYKDVGTGFCFDTYFFDKNQENGLGRQRKNGDIFYLVQVREKNINNRIYRVQTSTLFEWGEFASESTDIEFELFDSNGTTYGMVTFKDFEVVNGRVEKYKAEVGYCDLYLLSETDLIACAKSQLRDFLNKSTSFVKQKELPALIQEQ